MENIKQTGVHMFYVGVVVLAGALLAACSGGGSGTTGASAADTAVASMLADSTAPGFTGNWRNQNFFGSAASATASTTTMAATATANTYTIATTSKQLVNGMWGNAAVSGGSYLLGDTGWVLTTGIQGTMHDSGDGINISVSVGAATKNFSIVKTVVDGTPIACTDSAGTVVACSVPGNYPVGSNKYVKTVTADMYVLVDPAGAPGYAGITDVNGVLLTALPAASTTLCNLGMVYQPIAGAAAGVNNYNLYFATDCTAASIAAAVAAPNVPQANMLISTYATGNAAVPSVLRITNAITPVGSFLTNVDFLNNSIFGLRAGNVWMGAMRPAGTANPADLNKTAMNAELVASGFTAIP